MNIKLISLSVLFVLLPLELVAKSEHGHHHHHHHVDHAALEVERKEIRKRLQQWQAVIKKKEPAKVLGFYSADAMLMQVGQQPLLAKQIKRFWQQRFAQSEKFELILSRIGVSDGMKMAYLVGKVSLINNKAPNKKGATSGQWLSVWKKQNGLWVIVADSYAMTLE